MSKKKSKSSHYVDNEKFYEEMISWKKVVNEAAEMGEPKPPVTDYIGTCFLEIAERLSHRPNFFNYPYREEMVGDGIENCLQYASNFDPEKSKNPFSYFTQIIYYAFLRRIQKEKKQQYIKYKMMETMDLDRSFAQNINPFGGSKNPYADYMKLNETDLENFGPKKKNSGKTGDDECKSLF